MSVTKLLPSAGDVAIAIVTACRETGEDPIACAERAMGIRARHYALHALLHVFQDLGRHQAARLVGCPAKAEAFWNNSWHQVAKHRPGSHLRQTNWWHEGSYSRVIAAVEECTGSSVVIFRPSNEYEKSDADEAPFRLVEKLEYAPAPLGKSVTSSLMGDPPPGRSALADARPWAPYEARRT